MTQPPVVPERIQRQRTRGWRMPEGAVYVGRPSRWGNTYVVHAPEIVMRPDTGQDWWFPEHGAHLGAVVLFREWAGVHLAAPARRELAGRDLACWCPLDQPCHADVLLEIANAPHPTTTERPAAEAVGESESSDE